MKRLPRLFLIVTCQCFIVNYGNAQPSSAPVSVGRNVNVFPIDTGGHRNIQSEEHIYIDKTNPSYLILAANTFDSSAITTGYGAPYPQEMSEGYYYSHDGGNTWSGNDYFPNSPVSNVHSSPLSTYTTTTVGGDPATAIDADGNMYVASMTASDAGFGSSSYLLNVSNDHGVTWTLETPTYNDGVDKEMIAADDEPSSPYKNNVYCSWLDDSHYNPIMRFSTYNPNNTPPFTTPYILFYDSGATGYNGANIQTGPNGEIFECWSDLGINNGRTYGFYFCENTHGGDSGYWSAPYIPFIFTGIAPNGNTAAEQDFNDTRVNSFPSMAVDKSCGPNRGTVYVAFAAQLTSGPNNGDYVIEVASLAPPYTNTGSDKWADTIVSTATDTTNCFFPWIAVDDITGAVCVDYYKCANEWAVTSNFSTDTYLAYSIDRGATYNNVKVTDTSHYLVSIPVYNFGLSKPLYYEGDYIGIAAHNNIAYPTWMDGRHDNNQVFMAQVTIGALPINTNTTWGSSQVMSTDVEVTTGNTLTISAGITVEMPPGHQITVDTGAKLVVDGTITSTCGLWAGIYVEGNANETQTSAHQGTVQLNSGSEIEYASTGISTIKNTPTGWDWSYTGGIITANGATFYNNWRDIQFLYYSKPNKSSFTSCHFYVDNAYYSNYYAQHGLAQRVTMYQVHGVSFVGNNFANDISIDSVYAIFNRSGGIYSIDASYNVTNCNALCGPPPYTCCGTGNTFTGFEYGIQVANSDPSYSVQISGNSFTDNFFDIDIQNVNNMRITDNTFTKGAYEGIGSCTCIHPYNLYLDGCTAYTVSGNTFSNSYYENTYGNGISYGTIVYNSGTTNNLIDNNIYNGIYVQSQSQGTNGQKYFGFINLLVPPYVYITYSGLQYHCNQYNSGVNDGADISVASGLIDPLQGSCTNSSTTTANNSFTDGCINGRLNIYTFPSMPWGIEYSTASSDAPSNSCVSADVSLNICGSSVNCAPAYSINIQSGNMLLADGIPYHTTLRTQKRTFQHEQDSLDYKLLRGNTPGLYNVLTTGTPLTVIMDSLVAPGPYLSDSVLKTAISSGLIPNETLANNILIPNMPLDSNVVATLDGIGLPDTMVSRLNGYQSQNILSPRGVLIAGISNFQGLIDYTDNALITALETDSTITAPYDSAAAVVISDTLTMPRLSSGMLSSLAQLASLQWAAGENTTASVTLDTLNKRDIDSTYYNYCRLLPVLMTLSSNSNGYLSLKGNSTDSTLLEHIAMDTLTPGYANARAVLEFVYNQSFDEPELPLSTGHRPIRRNTDLLITTNAQNSTVLSQFSVYPNPASTEITFKTSSNESEYVIITDITGREIATEPILNNELQLNISAYSNGIYLYNILDNSGNVVFRGKFSVMR